MNSQAEILRRVAGAKVTQGGNNIRAGDYRYAIEAFKLNTGGHTGICFIAELRVLEARATDPNVPPNPVGTIVSQVSNITKNENALGDVKAFVLTAVGLDVDSTPDEDTQAVLDEALSPDNPLKGILLDNTTYEKINKGTRNPANKGKPMTLSRFRHVPGQTPEAIAAMRAELESAAPAAVPASQTVVAPAPAAPAPAAAAPAPAAARTSILSGMLRK